MISPNELSYAVPIFILTAIIMLSTLTKLGPRQRRVSPTPQDDMCEICGKKPKYIEPQGHKHPYCSRTCARTSTYQQQQQQAQAQAQPQHQTPSSFSFPGASATRSTPTTPNPLRRGQVQVESCVKCRIQPQSITGGRGLCISCDQIAAAATAAVRDGTRLREVGGSEAKFKQVRKQFINEWDSRNEGGLPTIDKIYEVILQRDTRSQYSSYRKKLSTPREHHTYHSSQCICDLGTKPGEAVLCDFKSCGICNILKSSFRAFAFEEPYNNGRFGEGIYSYKNPYLADAFATSCTSSPYRVMISCDVLVEKDTEFPNDTSLFVPTADAINPAYVIMYSKI